MLVRDIMTSPAVTIGPDAEVTEAARLLDGLSLTSLPVVDPGLRLLGIISEADVVARLARASDLPCSTPRVSDLMTRRVLSVAADDDLASAMDLMTRAVLKSLPVLLHNRVAGMLSRRDVVRAFAHGDLDSHPAERLPSGGNARPSFRSAAPRPHSGHGRSSWARSGAPPPGRC